ncbi:MAG: VWA domain-containing protein [Spirochaetales bacterium]|nr:VWA domain-containing protein [Spirochaetales bacterium]
MKNRLTIILIIIISSVIILSCTTAEQNDELPSDTAPSIDNSAEPSDAEDIRTEEEAVDNLAKADSLELADSVSSSVPESSGAKERLKPGSGASAGLRDEDYGSELEMPMMIAEEDFSGDRESKSMKSEAMGGSNIPTHSGLKAGYSDDNRQYGYFLNFLEKYRQDILPLDLDISERIVLKVSDRNGKSMPGAQISITTGNGRMHGLTLADGSYQINPSNLDGDEVFKLEIDPGRAYQENPQTLNIDRAGDRSIDVSFDVDRIIPEPIPLDIVFVMDTTGSMGEEISRLKETIRIIHMNLTSLSVPAEVRFGMVLYKDVGDEYVTSIIPLTADIDQFQIELDLVQAYGGGDMPEDLEKALDDLVNLMQWNENGVRLAYIITDAPPHLDYGRQYSCSRAAVDARAAGIKIYGIGTGGLDLQGEYVLRQIAQYTSARYIFLTYGDESGESGGGTAGSVSHHTGSNWSADKLESIIIRFTKEELSYLSDSPLLDEDAWFQADRIDTEKIEDTLASLFDQAVNQLLDFSTWPVTKERPVAVLPFSSDAKLTAGAEYFTEHLILSAGLNERITLAERKDLGQLLGEIEFQNVGMTDDSSVSKIGELLNAEVLITGNLFMKDGKYELFLKMLRTETAEVLSVTRAVIAAELGL